MRDRRQRVMHLIAAGGDRIVIQIEVVRVMEEARCLHLAAGLILAAPGGKLITLIIHFAAGVVAAARLLLVMV